MLLLFVCMTGMAITNAAIPWCTSFPIMLSMVFLCGMFEGSIETGTLSTCSLSSLSLTHCRRNRLSHTIYWKTPISILDTSGYEIYILLEKNG